MAQVIVINSPNTGTGKTMLSAHLAVILAKDYKLPCLTILITARLPCLWPSAIPLI